MAGWRSKGKTVMGNKKNIGTLPPAEGEIVSVQSY